jgi:hypothetical protein
LKFVFTVEKAGLAKDFSADKALFFEITASKPRLVGHERTVKDRRPQLCVSAL